ncbi:MAG: glycoside hydrolase family 38 C-terminal domain-containing protein [Candidatus Pseudobacter hemicellulosilyticus]|uniref:Glycoside hydrolase family 38 C-terminal domain-containing protein n=1 Tax=Candidatus Pseudobacter hemicellulosilyticus TaxID=3121375 RepID=A0AAJ6BFB2_9BACT|nr:MAG: glycoside hydrolase family 38 C-terminal domain-containing protein [Pseudobacter sp.]
MRNYTTVARYCLAAMLIISSTAVKAQPSWFIDGYHGGIWGHYPKGYTTFIVEQLRQHPYWKLNLEIEPDTWDSVRVQDPEAFAALQSFLEAGRIDYVNPAYGQPYLFNGSGESMIRQFHYGMKKLRDHFPGISFTTYSSEEPCFTSALPQVLRSFGFKYASLKNPNTCWGGYTRAHGGELVNWISQDGSSLLTVPRYATEGLEKNSTWQTTAWTNSPDYFKAARAYGIQHPVAMTLQDAGWRNGPWIGKQTDTTQTQYSTWLHYFEKIADHRLATDWKLSQEDIQVSLVWGAQILQRLAQQVRRAENKLVATEKLASIAVLSPLPQKFSWPQSSFDRAWQQLLLAQHHDCWIVPYNGIRGGGNWANKVQAWTGDAERICDSISNSIYALFSQPGAAPDNPAMIQVFNTTGIYRYDLVTAEVPEGLTAAIRSVQFGKQYLPVQLITNPQTGKKEMLFHAPVHETGMQFFTPSVKNAGSRPATVTQQEGRYILDSYHYRLTIDSRQGGAITSLISKVWTNQKKWRPGKEWIPAGQAFNALQGNFYQHGGRLRATSQPAIVSILEQGALRIRVLVSGAIAGQPYRQTITLVQGEPRIDCSLEIDWQENIPVGDPYGQDNYKAEDLRKAFYNDRDKLLLTFPLNIDSQAIDKNAPFAVTRSQLDNTLFTTWDSIKNNVLLHWVDAVDAKGSQGMALFTDHTTAYVHGRDQPLSLVVQYAGKGLWGMNYAVNGPTRISYSLLPHQGQWDKAELEAERVKLSEPLQVINLSAGARHYADNFRVRFSEPGWEISSMRIDGKDLLIRLYNTEASEHSAVMILNLPDAKASLENLDGSTIGPLDPIRNQQKLSLFNVTAPRFGIRTIRVSNIVQ